jgi:tetratricopeptide (TPR) repeat protein
VVKVRGDYARARTILREATEIFEELGDRSGAAWSINQLGDIARDQGETDAARNMYERALSTFREAGDRWGTARSLADLGHLYCEHGQYEAARGAYREALAVFAQLDHKRGLARTFEGFACLAVALGEPKRALILAAAASHLRRLISAPLTEAEQAKLDEALSSASEALGDAEGKTAWAEGSEMTIDSAIQYSLAEPRAITAGSRDQ